MSRLSELLRQVALKDERLAADLKRETDALAERLAFGLNFERHVPEAVKLPGRPVRKNDKVRCLPPRGESPTAENDRLWRVHAVYTEDGQRWADIVSTDDIAEGWSVVVDDLVVVAEFRDPIYPGLVSTGKVERGGPDKPYHTVINAENYHALQSLLFTDRGKVDAIYIDPPYNTGAKDWKYNNDYVEGDDLYRHSKWLAMMERRLLLAKELLNPDESVLIVTIDEKEYLRLGLLLEQTFPRASMKMISSLINPKGVGVTEGFKRVDEYIFILRFAAQQITRSNLVPLGSKPTDVAERERAGTDDDDAPAPRIGLDWQTARRRDLASVRRTRPAQFYPIYVNTETGMIEEIGEPIPHAMAREDAPQRDGCAAVFPVRDDGTEMNWGVTAPTFRERWEKGYARAGSPQPNKPQSHIIQYLKSGPIAHIEEGRATIEGRNPDGSVIAYYEEPSAKAPPTQWNLRSHNAEHYGTKTVRALLGGNRFDFPKSLYAVEDVLRLFVGDDPDALIVDFFSGSGTTAHAVMRLNKQDGGRRRSISVTNNEVSAGEQIAFRDEGLRPGDADWEAWGICEYVTKSRIRAAITGKTPEGEPVKGEYRFVDEFPMAEGFEENVEFFTLTYEAPLRVSTNREFAKVAPFLWLRAGSRGRRIDDISTGWDVADAYGVLADLDQSEQFLKVIDDAASVTHAFIVTDEDRLFEAMVRQLPAHVEPVRLYEAYLRNFEIEAGRAAR
jgi:adenine-specific DNA-methyltransferase